jgi:putative Mg2+ transporter-C (MgtC) family protein
MEAFLAENLPIFIKLTLAVLLGAIIGTERSLVNKAAGIRTYAFMSLGACLLTIISQMALADDGGAVNADPMRMAAAVVMGIGFICGGLIVYNENKLIGLTTAAGMWVATGVGIAVGFGYFTIAVITSALCLFIFSVLWNLEEKVKENR